MIYSTLEQFIIFSFLQVSELFFLLHNNLSSFSLIFFYVLYFYIILRIFIFHKNFFFILGTLPPFSLEKLHWQFQTKITELEFKYHILESLNHNQMKEALRLSDAHPKEQFLDIVLWVYYNF